MEKLKFALIGSSGYIAPRHINAINKIGGEVVLSLDIVQFDYSLKHCFEEDEFFRFLQKFNIDYCSICSPNFLHAQHIKKCIELGVSVICEKPICLTVEEFDEISKLAKINNVGIFSIMQLRLHPVIETLKNERLFLGDKVHKGSIRFITPRKKDYFDSWKMKNEKSGGILFNLGIHYFDILITIFGDPLSSDANINKHNHIKGATEFRNLSIDWEFQIYPSDNNILPKREFSIDSKLIDFSDVSEDLHLKNYERILTYNEFGISEVKQTMDFIFKLKDKFNL